MITPDPVSSTIRPRVFRSLVQDQQVGIHTKILRIQCGRALEFPPRFLVLCEADMHVCQLGQRIDKLGIGGDCLCKLAFG